MSSGNQPLLSPPDSVRPVRIPREVMMKEKTIVEGSLYQKAWYREKVDTTVLNVSVADGKWRGETYNALGMYSNHTMAQSCPCYQFSGCNAAVLAVFFLKLKFANGKTQMIDNFTSKSFTKLFMKKYNLPPGLHASQFTLDRRVTPTSSLSWLSSSM